MFYLFLADGFEETEAIAPIDILKRFGKEVVTVGIGGGKITKYTVCELAALLKHKTRRNII